MHRKRFHNTVLCLALVSSVACSKPPSAEDGQRYKHLPLTAAAAGSAAPPPSSGSATCYTPLSLEHPATLEFRRVFAAGDYAARDNALAELTAAASAYPNEEEFAVLLGLGNLWRAAEGQNLTDAFNALDSAQTTISELERAYALCPSDVRLLAWLGPATIMVGQLLFDSAQVEAGQRLLEVGIERYHLFATFSNVVIYGNRPTHDPLFLRALDSARFYLNDAQAQCAQQSSSVCINSPEVPHNIEGTAVYLGDVFARAQDRALALKAYKLAKGTQEFASWQFQSVIETRIQTLDARIEAAANRLDLDDHELASESPNQCLYCHRK